MTSLVLLLGLALGATAPKTSFDVPVDELRAPAAPGFVLLGKAPSAIERPRSPKAFALSLLSAASEGDLLPRNYAFEIAPYWLTSHAGLSFERYYHAGVARSLVQNFAVSLATVTATAQSGPDAGTRLGFGLRSLLVAGRAAPELAAAKVKLLAAQELCLDLEDTALEKCLKGLEVEAKAIAALNRERVGWTVEIAGGIVGRFPQSNFNAASFERWGVWLTPSYRPSGRSLSILGVARYLRDQRPGSAERAAADVGARLVWEIHELALSGEAVERLRVKHAGDPRTSLRATATAEYRVKDGIYVAATFGKDHDSTGNGDGTLVALFGVNFVFGKKPLVTLD